MCKTEYLIEVKDYASPVSIEKIRAFITTVNDIKNHIWRYKMKGNQNEKNINCRR